MTGGAPVLLLPVLHPPPPTLQQHYSYSTINNICESVWIHCCIMLLAGRRCRRCRQCCILCRLLICSCSVRRQLSGTQVPHIVLNNVIVVHCTSVFAKIGLHALCVNAHSIAIPNCSHSQFTVWRSGSTTVILYWIETSGNMILADLRNVGVLFF